MNKLLAALIVAASLPLPARAQDSPPLPDPATIVVPDLSGSVKPEVVKEGAKYFLFHKEGVSFETAHADLSECFLFLQPGSWESVNMGRFVPWESRAGRRTLPSRNPYGLVGAVLLDIAEGPLAHRDYQAKMRTCMEPRGYRRHGVAAAIWKRVTGLPPEQSIGVQAKIASGPAFGKQVPNQ
jgi:hypothetical protein